MKAKVFMVMARILSSLLQAKLSLEDTNECIKYRYVGKCR